MGNISITPGEAEALSRLISDKGYTPYFKARYSAPLENVQACIMENQAYAVSMGISPFPLMIFNGIMGTTSDDPSHLVRFELNWNEEQGLHVSSLLLRRQTSHEGHWEVSVPMQIDEAAQIPTADQANALIMDTLNQARQSRKIPRRPPDVQIYTDPKHQRLAHRIYELPDFLEMMKQKGYGDLTMYDEFGSIRAGELPKSKSLLARMPPSAQGPAKNAGVTFSIEYSPVYKYQAKKMEISRCTRAVYASVTFENLRHNHIPSLVQATKVLVQQERKGLGKRSKIHFVSYDGWNKRMMGRTARL